MNHIVPVLGVGLGYRAEMKEEIGTHLDEIDFFELIGDSLFDREVLESTLEAIGTKPAVCHFLGLSLGTDASIDESYLRKVEEVLATVRPPWFSDHLAVTSVADIPIGHLAPPFFRRETGANVARHVRELQSRTGVPFLLENIAYSFVLPGATLRECDLLADICHQADCGLLLDLNNLYVNSHNHGYDAYEFLRNIPLERSHQIHIAGAELQDGLMIDCHAASVSNEVFRYLDFVRRKVPIGAVLLEWDRDFPPFETIAADLRRARRVLSSGHREGIADAAGMGNGNAI